MTNTERERETTTTLAHVVQTWDRFWFSPADPISLSFIRLCAGLLVFYVHLTYSWDLLCYIGPEAWIDHDIASYMQKDMPVYALNWGWDPTYDLVGKGNYYWSIYYHVTETPWLIALHVGFLVAMLLYALGLFSRTTGILTWIGAMAYAHRANATVYGMDTMMMIVLLYLMIGPSGATLSLDRWLACRKARRQGLPDPEVQPSYSANFALRLIQVHFCIIYLAGGTSKLLGSTWWGGTALNLVMLNVSFAPLEWGPYYHLMRMLAEYRPVWEVVMAGGILFTLLLEISFTFLIWDLRWRWMLITCSVLLHTFIGFCMGLITFSLMMLIMVSAFIPPEVLRAYLQGFGLARSARPAPALVGTSRQAG